MATSLKEMALAVSKLDLVENVVKETTEFPQKCDRLGEADADFQ